ncbi:MAG: OprO/OprP family phosphate-selective porin [Gammaproteobacteria bacterium]|nr:OprO/OprP family phosphate-selective porin [Gammaproteobacteria bacterium]
MRVVSVIVLSVFSLAAIAEPYLAVESGLGCASCHTNPSGGGQRSAFGNTYLQQALTARPTNDAQPWTGTLMERFTVGANARSSARQFELDDRDDNLDFGLDRVSLYLGANLNDAVSLYLDQQIAPGSSLNREAWAKLSWDEWYLKAGRMFLPLGWRLEDDTAFVREITGINMRQGDDGLEIGYESSKFTLQLSATNGNGGGSETDDGKLFVGRVEYIQPRWRAGLSGAHNSTDFGERTIIGAFAGLKTGRVSWLAEYDHIDDEGFGLPDMQQGVALLEANVRLRKGHNLKITAEAQLFDNDEDQDAKDRYRGSLVYEYFPWAFAQLRAGIRARDSSDDLAALNSEEAFVQLHVLF